LRGKLIISCQDYIESMIPAAVRGGASALRVNGPEAVRFARAKTSLPLIACNKTYFPGSEVYLTPTLRTAMSLIAAGAEMIAFDARDLPRPRQSVAEMIAGIHAAGRIAVADIQTHEEGMAAHAHGADVVATTFASEFSPQLVSGLAGGGVTVLAEGKIDSAERVREASLAGAWAVCVGTAITRPHLLADHFRQAMEQSL